MKKRAFAFIVLAGVLWGTSGIFVNLLKPYGFTSMQLTAVRGLVSFLCVAAFALIRARRLFVFRLRDLWLLVLVGIAQFGTAFCYYMSMVSTSIATAVVLMYTAPIYVTVFSVLFLGERFSKLKGVSIGLMLVGCALVSGIVGGLKFDPVGILFGVLAGLSYGAYSICSKVAVRRGIQPLQCSLYSFLMITLISAPLCDVSGLVASVGKEPLPTLPLLLGIGIVTFVLPYVLYTFSLRDLPAGTASALSIVEPMAATLFGIVFFDEKLSLLPTLGMVLILLAVFLLSRVESGKDASN